MVEQYIDDKQWDLFLKINNHRNTPIKSKKLRLKVPNDIKKRYINYSRRIENNYS